MQDMVNEIDSGMRSPTLYYELEDFLGKGDYDGATLCIQNCYYCSSEMATSILALFKEQIYDKNQIRLNEARARALARGGRDSVKLYSSKRTEMPDLWKYAC